MSLARPAHFVGVTFKLSLKFNDPRHKQTVYDFFESKNLQNGIAQLNLESDDRLNTLIKVLQRGWKRGIRIIMRPVSSTQQFRGIYTAQEAKMVMDVANMLALVVGKEQSEYPQEDQNEKLSSRLLNTAIVIFVEIFHEVCTGSDGGFSKSFLSKDLLALVAQTPQQEPVSKETQEELDDLRFEFEAMLKKKDDEVQKLKAQNLVFEQLRGANTLAEKTIRGLTSEKRTLMDRLQSKTKEYNELELQVDPEGVNTMRTQLARAQTALREVKSANEELKEELANEKAKNKDTADAE